MYCHLHSLEGVMSLYVNGFNWLFFLTVKLAYWPMLAGDHHTGFPEIDLFFVSFFPDLYLFLVSKNFQKCCRKNEQNFAKYAVYFKG
jgi:hypothetical protein